MPLTLTYCAKTTVPVEVAGFTPAGLRGASRTEIEKRTILHGNQRVPLAELFRVAGTSDDEQLTFVGDLSGVHSIGAKMDRGVIRVEGNAGRHLGSELAGGEIQVTGDAGDWVGGEMRSGLIHVRGNAGDRVGSAYRGSPRGMIGGTLLIGGNCGDELGHNLRRGLIAVGGNVGDAPGLNLIAGTILVMGGVGIRPVAGMRRGTLAVFGKTPELLPTFRPSGLGRPLYLRLYFAALRRQGFAVPPELDEADYRLFAGDLLAGGRGEVLTRAI